LTQEFLKSVCEQLKAAYIRLPYFIVD